MVVEAAVKYSLPIAGLLAMLKAESNLNPKAARYGTWPDVSFGYSQLTVQTAASYGIGDGSDTPINIANVREKLFDRKTAIDVGARHLSGCYAAADAAGWASRNISRDLAALVIYNAGWLPPLDSRWWITWTGNVTNYTAALKWVESLL